MDIVHDENARQFRTEIDGHRGVTEYHLRDGVMTITHTGVPPEIGGRGIAGELTRFALQTARREGWRVVPACSYAASYIQRHPEFTDLLA